MIKHKHHIIPKHSGGSNDSSNIVELSIEEHANAHRILFEKYGKKEDFVAWKMLSGKTDECEKQRIELAKEGFEKFQLSDQYNEYKDKISKSLKGKSHSVETKRKRSEALKKAHREGKHPNPFSKMPKSFFADNYEKTNANKRLSEARKNSKKWKESVTSDEYRMKKCISDPRSKQVEYDGVIYPSIRNAAKSLGISYSKMRKILDKK